MISISDLISGYHITIITDSKDLRYMDDLFYGFISHFDVVKRYNNTAQCKCPAHDDRKASLSIALGTENPDCIVMKCHAGCTNQDILKAAGLSEKDMFRKDVQGGSSKNTWKQYIEKREGKKIEALYHYHSFFNGSYAFSKVRLEGKSIIYGRFNGNYFRYGLNGKSAKEYKAIYGDIKGIKQAIASDEVIFITEGEKDVDTMTKYGYKACTYGSVSDWQSDLAELFKGARVVVLADNDKSGKEVASRINNDLQGVASSSMIVIPTPNIDKGDISDYFENHTKEDFEKLMKTDEAVFLPVVADSVTEVGLSRDIRDMLLYDDKQKLRNIVRNIEIVLEQDIRFKNRIRYNEFSHTIDILGALPWKDDNSCRAWNNSDDASLFSVLQCEYGFSKRQDCIDALEIVANNNAYNPVKDILESLEYKGDGYIRKLLPCYLGCADTEYTYQVMELFMLGAVNRIYRAGCKFDYTLMLQGKQGLGKSTFLQLLALDDSWFNDSLDSLDNKDSIQGLIGSWIIELAELKSFARTTGGMDSIKRFLTATQDKVRLSYARRVEVFPRMCVFAGTTNRADFLMDETGNRRFLVVMAGENKPTKNLFDRDEVMSDIKGAWAEAMHIFKTENRPLVLPVEFEQEARSIQEQCLVEDVRTGIIEKFLEGKNRTCIIEIWQEALKQEGQPLKHQSRDIAEIILSLGFKKLGSPRKYGSYGSQRIFERITKVEEGSFIPCGDDVPFSA